RLLRIVQHADTARIELIHDRLVPVVRKARDERISRQHRDEQIRLAKEAEAERDRERARSEELRRQRDKARRTRTIAVAAAAISIVLGLVSCGFLGWAWIERQAKEHLKLTAEFGMTTSRFAE